MSLVGRGRVTSATVALALLAGCLALGGVATSVIGPRGDEQPGARPNALAALVPEDGYVTRSTRVTITGLVGRSAALAVADLSIPPGQYTLRVSFTARLSSAYNPVALRCGVIDNNGTRQFLAIDQNPVRSGRAADRHRITAIFGLPDVTIGLRCYTSTTALVSATFDNVVLAAVPR